MLAFASIRSILEFAASVLNSLQHFVFQNLEVLQSCEIKVALGLPKWTPNILLRKHARANPHS